MRVLITRSASSFVRARWSSTIVSAIDCHAYTQSALARNAGDEDARRARE
jgi:hypothetical protein